MRHHAESSLNHHDSNNKKTIDLDKNFDFFSVTIFFYFFSI